MRSFFSSRTGTHRVLLRRSAVLWLVLELLAAAQVRGPSGVSVLSSWLRTAVSPPISLVITMVATAEDLVSGFGDTQALAAENERLRRENAHLRIENSTLSTDLQAALQATDGLESMPVFAGIPARLIHRDLGRGLLLVSLDSDRNPWVQRDTPVLGNGGVVGRVVRVEGRNCWIESVIRSGAAIAVSNTDGTIQGLAEGEGKPLLAVRFVSHRASLAVGETLLSSGADGVQLPGFPVAVVTSVRESGGPFLAVQARPIADPMTLRTVWLIEKPVDENSASGSGR